MRRRLATASSAAALLALACAILSTAPAQAAFGVHGFDLTFVNEDGSAATQAGSHPYALKSGLEFDTAYDPHFEAQLPDGNVKDLIVKLPAGFAGTAVGLPRCSTADFLVIQKGKGRPDCPLNSAIGAAKTKVSATFFPSPIFNLPPPPGVIVKFGFWAFTTPVTFEVGLSPNPPYKVVTRLTDISEASPVYRGFVELWGIPAAPVHDPYRGSCLAEGNVPGHEGFEEFGSQGICESSAPEIPFLTLPTSCQGPVSTSYAADSWQSPGALLADGEPDLGDPRWVAGAIESHETSQPPTPQGMTGCSKLGFKPSIAAKPTTLAASSPTGLDFSLDVKNEGLTSPTGIANSNIRKSVVTLPDGMSTNPSLAEGLNVCSEADLARETPFSEPGAGCPNESKIGTVEVESPLLEETLDGSLFIAKPYENPFGSLIALYIVIKNPRLGILVKQPLRVENDPLTGQITTVAEEMPQLPFSHFRLHFREGTRSPLVTPPACGTYDAKAVLTPWSGGAPVETTSAFQIISGPGNSPCPSGGLPPLHPQLSAGTLNNAAGHFSPFNVKLTRTDSEQEFTHFSIKLPPGIAGKLAGIPFCSEAAIAAATARTGPHGGQEEIERPSCPAASQVGRTLAGAGVGPSLAYAPGKVYLAGPYHGHPVSLVAITAGVVGPFDIGTVVVRLAIDVNPETGEVFLDSTGSDPIPHIIKGIPVHLRDIRAYADRPEFTFNPTSCEPTSTSATVLGSGLDFVSAADDNPFVATSRFQAADCAALPFAPKLSLRLSGGTKRGDFPKLKAFLRMRGFGEAGVSRAQVTLPKSEFIANAHFNTICTRVQFKEAAGNGEACPAGSVYGWARAKTPILSEPLEGPVYLRSSEHQLPDVVASLRGQEINVHLVGHVDSVKGRLRNTFETVPDAPVEWASFAFQGQKKGLFENSTDLCVGKHKATVKFTGHNGKHDDYETAIEAPGCKKARKGKAKHKR